MGAHVNGNVISSRIGREVGFQIVGVGFQVADCGYVAYDVLLAVVYVFKMGLEQGRKLLCRLRDGLAEGLDVQVFGATAKEQQYACKV